MTLEIKDLIAALRSDCTSSNDYNLILFKTLINDYICITFMHMDINITLFTSLFEGNVELSVYQLVR